MSDKRILEFETATEAGNTDFVAIDSLAGGTRKIVVTDLPGGGGGTTVVPNPVGEPTDELETIKIGSIIYNIPGSGGSGFQITKLWNYADDNEGVIPYRTYSALTLNDNISNYDAIFLELISDIQDVSDWHASCLTPFWSVEAIMNSYWPGYITYTTYDTRSSQWHFTDTTIECTRSDPNMVNGLVNVYGVKFGGGNVNALDYSTTEQDTGKKWIDGKPIYQKTIVLKDNNTEMYTYSNNEFVGCLPNDIGDYINIIQVYSDRRDTQYIDVGITGGEVIVVPDPYTTNLYFTSNHTPKTCIVTIEYTKSST